MTTVVVVEGQGGHIVDTMDYSRCGSGDRNRTSDV